MADQIQALRLDFRLEPGAGNADLERSAAAVKDSVSTLPAVNDVDARVTERTRDPLSTVAILLTISVAIKNSSDAVQELDKLVTNIKDLARNLGLPHLWLWVRRKKIAVDDLTAEHLQDLAQAAPKGT